MSPRPICLGSQYMYKTGYDPGAFVDFFEKIEALERKKPGTLSTVLFLTSSHGESHCHVAKEHPVAILRTVLNTSLLPRSSMT